MLRTVQSYFPGIAIKFVQYGFPDERGRRLILPTSLRVFPAGRHSAAKGLDARRLVQPPNTRVQSGSENCMLDFYSFVDQTNKRLDEMINEHGSDTVFVGESADYVEWRRDAYAVRLSRDTAA